MGIARDTAARSMETTEAGDRAGWLALFAPDALVEDPVGPSLFDPDGTGHRGIEAITAFYDNVIAMAQSIKFTITRSIECGNEVANVGSIRITLPGDQVGIVEIVNVYRVDDEGRLVSLRSFWEQEKLTFGPA